MDRTHTSSYGIDGCPEAQSQATSHSVSLLRRERWAHLLSSQHYQPLIAEILEEELPKHHASNTLPRSLHYITRECVAILASASPILIAVVEGTLAQRILVDPELQREYAMLQERAHVQPSIYIHLLVDAQGIPPTPNQYTVVRDTILQYLSSGAEYLDLAWQIDNITPPPVRRFLSANGHRKFLWTSHRSPQHMHAFRRFCDGVALHVAETPVSQRDLPMRYPPTECGYSINSHVRIAQHHHRQSSNYVMNLVEDVCGYLHQTGVFEQRFSMHAFIVYLIFRPEQAAIAEIFCSGLLQVWIEGGGLNAYPAGRSVASARKVGQTQWEAHERWVEENTGLVRNIGVQRERIERDVEYLDREMEEVWREALSEEGNDGDDPRDLDYVPGDFMGGLDSMRLDE